MKKLYVVGLGPGDEQNMTGRALTALEESEVIVGYTAYVDLIRARYPEKAFLATAMRGEVERCRMALEAACGGRTVAVVSSGDAGVYGMAGLVYELAQGYDPIDIEVVPGVTAACSGAALLGAPLIHDFAVISLSDRLPPWELIDRRRDAAGRADFCSCLSTPARRRRADYLRRACDILLRSRAPETVAGLVRNAGRAGESARVLTLGELREAQADMFTTVFIGNSQTKKLNGGMVTPRGYRDA